MSARTQGHLFAETVRDTSDRDDPAVVCGRAVADPRNQCQRAPAQIAAAGDSARQANPSAPPARITNAPPSECPAMKGKSSSRSSFPASEDAIASTSLQLLPQKTGEPLDRAPRPRQHSRPLCHRAALPIFRRKSRPRATASHSRSRPRRIFLWARSMWRARPPVPRQTRSSTRRSFSWANSIPRRSWTARIENIRQLMQEGGYYRARVTAESTSNPPPSRSTFCSTSRRGSRRMWGR